MALSTADMFRRAFPGMLYCTEVGNNAPPGSPATGDRVVVGTAGSGAFSGHNNDIAYYTGSAWTFVDAEQGQRAFSVATRTVYGWSGSAWTALLVIPSAFTTEDAQDAVGAMVDGTLTYEDGTPLLQRAALTGAVTAPAGSNVTAFGTLAARSVLGVSGEATAVPAAIAATDDTWAALREHGGGIGWQPEAHQTLSVVGDAATFTATTSLNAVYTNTAAGVAIDFAIAALRKGMSGEIVAVNPAGDVYLKPVITLDGGTTNFKYINQTAFEDSWSNSGSAVHVMRWSYDGTRLLFWGVLPRTAAATDARAGIAELATIAETSAGTDTTHVVTPDGLAGSVFGTASLLIHITDSGTGVSVGDGIWGVAVPSSMNGMNIVAVRAVAYTAGATNTTDLQLRRRRAGASADVLSTKITMAAQTLCADGVIDTANDDLATGDILFADVDAIETTAPLGVELIVEAMLP